MKLPRLLRALPFCALLFAPAALRADDSNPLVGGGEIGVRVEMRDGPGIISFPNPIPEPSTLALLALGASALGITCRSRRG